MRVLTIDSDQARRATLSTTLRELGLDVHEADNPGRSEALLARHHDLIFVGAAMGCVREHLLIRTIRRLSKPKQYPYLVLFGSGLSEEELAAAYSAGADSHISSLEHAPTLRSRVEVARRIGNAVAGRSPKSTSAAQKSPKAAGNSTPLQGSALSEAWTSARVSLQDAAGTFLGLQAAINENVDSTEPSIASSIVLSNVEEELELRLALGCDLASAKQLSMHLFGDDDDELAADVISELANVFMGTLKSSFSKEALSYTGGLPQPVAADTVLRPTTVFAHQDAFVVEAATARITVHLGLRSKGNVFVGVRSLREGMVLANDVLNMRGMRLVVAGTRLSETIIERLQRTAIAAGPIEVMAN